MFGLLFLETTVKNCTAETTIKASSKFEICLHLKPFSKLTPKNKSVKKPNKKLVSILLKGFKGINKTPIIHKSNILKMGNIYLIQNSHILLFIQFTKNKGQKNCPIPKASYICGK